MTATDQWPLLVFQWEYFSWLQMLWKLKTNLSKIIDFYIISPRNLRKSGYRRWEEDASLRSLNSALISSNESDEEVDVLRTRPLEWRSEEVSMFFSQFGLSLWKKYVQPAKKSNLLTEGLVLQVQEAVMKFLSHCSGPLNCSSFHFLMLDNSGASIHF